MPLGATLGHLAAAPSHPPEPVVDQARRLVDAGFESLWIPQIVGRGSLVLDPFVALAAAAVATEGSGVEIGTATVQVPLHHPADLAYRILSLQNVCGRRLSLGVSPGSTKDDYEAFDRDHATRFRTFYEHLARLRVLLAVGRDDAATLTSGAPSYPPPPLLLGSWGANVERAAAEFDGWLAAAVRRSVPEILEAHDRYRAAGGQRAMVCAIRVTGEEDLRSVGQGLEHYAAAGFDDAIVVIEPGGPDPTAVRRLF